MQSSRYNFEKMDEKELVMEVKKIVNEAIDEYLFKFNTEDRLLYLKVSFSTLNNSLGCYTGDEGRKRAIAYKEKINTLNSSSALLWTLYDDLNAAAEENEKKTAYNRMAAFLGEGYDYIRAKLSDVSSKASEEDKSLGNSTFLAKRIASRLCIFLGVDPLKLMEKTKQMGNLKITYMIDASYINPELGASVRFLYDKIHHICPRLENNKRI